MTCVLVEGANKWPSQWNQEQEGQDQITSFCICSGFMAIGRKGGTVEMFTRDLQESLTEQWAKELLDDTVGEMAFSQHQQFVSVGAKTNGKIVILDVLTGMKMVGVGLGEGVTHMIWENQKLFVGGDLGTVAVVEESSLKQVLELDSRLVQLAVAGEILVASTLTRAVLANTNNKTFREIGTKLRHGNQGVVVVGNRVWAARPGCRLWEVDIEEGMVLATRQYKKALNQIPASPIHNLRTDKNDPVGEHCFLSLITEGNGIVVSSSEDGNLYILDMQNSRVLAWARVAKGRVTKMMLLRQTIVLLTESGAIMSVCFGMLQDVLKRIHSLHMDQLCGDILLRNRKSLRNMTSEARDIILSLKSITKSMPDADRSVKLSQVFEILSDWRGSNGSNGELRRRVSSGPHQALYNIYNGHRHNRSMSQERNPHPHCHRGSAEGILQDDAVSGKCHSQEDLLVSGRRQSAGHTSRSLSGSRRNMSASEQGLQALQLYNIKCGGKARSLQPSPLTSRNVSAERLEQVGWRTRRVEEDKGVCRTNKSEEHLGRWSNKMIQDAYSTRKDSEGSENWDKLEEWNSQEHSQEIRRHISVEMLEDCTANIKNTDELMNRLEEQARQAGLQIHMSKAGDGEPHARDSIDQNEFWERHESRFPLSEWEFGSYEGGLYGADVIGSSITAGVEKLLETGAKLASDSALAGIVSSIKDLDSPRKGVSSRIHKQLRDSIRIKKIEEIGLVAAKINQSTNDETAIHIKTFASLIIEEYLEQNRKSTSGDSLSSSDDSDTSLVPHCLGLSQQIKNEEIQQINKSFEVIFSNDVNREIFFRPVGDVSVRGMNEELNLVSMKLAMVYLQKYIEIDKLVWTGLVLVSDLIDPRRILPLLTETDLNTYTFLMSLETSLNPDLSPIQLEQIDERNVFECSSFLGGYNQLDNMTTMRYLQHIAQINTDAAIDIVNSLSHTLTTSHILLIAFSYYESLMSSISQDLEGHISLASSADVELSSFVARLVSCHVSGHVEAWAATCRKHTNFITFLTDVFLAANSASLATGPSIIGAHRCQRGLQMAPLGEFLIKMLDLEKQDCLDFCKKTLFMSGFVRSILLEPSQSTKEIPLLVELGDPGLLLEIGLLERHTVTLVVEHLLAVYGHSGASREEQGALHGAGDTQAACPIQWDELAQLMLERAGPSMTMHLLKSASHMMKPGTLSARFYAQLIIDNLNHKLDAK